tara:strand:- start:1598 stop:2971 length:1374 start_codon:yes stop_codon:yes gene_type:complete
MILDFLFTLNTLETILLISLFLCCIYQLYKSYLHKNWYELFKPINIYALLTLFYCVVGPILSSGQGDGTIMYRAIDHREYYQIGLLASLISFLSFQLGFDYKNNFLIKDFGINKTYKKEVEKKTYLFLYKWGERLFILTMFAQFIVFGIGLINQIRFIGNFNFSQNFVIYKGGFTLVFVYTINFLVVSILLMFISILNGVKEKFKFVFYLSITISIFLTYSFRWRFFVLFFPLLLIYYFYKKTKPKIIYLLSTLLAILFFFGFVQITRTYGRGLSLETYERTTRNSDDSFINKVIKASFFDSNVFNTSAGMLYHTPSKYNYIGFTPLTNTLLLPIPRKIWPNKPSGDYMQEIYKIIYPGKLWEVGSASLGFAEYYISGGWIALITLNFFLGYLYKRLWIWFFYNFYDPIVQINYALYLSFLFVIYSRGYFLQITFIYITLFLPIIWLTYIWNKRLSS